MRVTIVTPSFNQAAFLERTLLSVLEQDHPDVEYMVLDGGSTDGSLDILNQYRHRLAWCVSEPDAGQTAAIAKGLAQASGDVLAWLCSDDLLFPCAARLAVDELSRYPDIGVVYGDRLYVDASGNVVDALRLPPHSASMLRMNHTLPQECTFFRRDAYLAVGGLDLTLQCSMDFDLWCRLSAYTRFRHIPAFLGCYRTHFDAKSAHFDVDVAGSGNTYRVEHQAVYRRHFGAPPPTQAAALAYRLYRSLRLAYALSSPRLRAERQAVRRRMSQSG